MIVKNMGKSRMWWQTRAGAFLNTNLFWLETPKLGAVVISIIPVMFYRRANLESDQYSIFGKTLMSRCELHTQKESHLHKL